MKVDVSKLKNVLEYLDDFSAAGFQIEFDTQPDVDAPSENFDYHIHQYWELKFFRERNLLTIQKPETVHCMTGNDLVIAVTFQCLSVFDRDIEFSDDNIRNNFLPELLNLLSKLPVELQFDGIRNAFGNAVITNIKLLLKQNWHASERQWKKRSLSEIALNYMENHYYQSSLSVVDIARFVGVSPQTMNAVFRRDTGLTTRQNLIKIRLHHATLLLANPKYMIKDVAALTGWHSAFYFCNTFRRVFKYSPSEQREKSNLSSVKN